MTPLDMAAVGALFGVPPATVARWRVRYRDTERPCPEPIIRTARPPLWAPEQAQEWRVWHDSRPGRTGRPPKAEPRQLSGPQVEPAAETAGRASL